MFGGLGGRLQVATMIERVPRQAGVSKPAAPTLARATLDENSLQKTTFPAAIQAGRIVVSGKREKVGELPGLRKTFLNMFPIAEPRRSAERRDGTVTAAGQHLSAGRRSRFSA